MTFFVRQDIGRVYVLKLVLPEGPVVHKIGMTNSDRAVDRMLEILRSWFMKFRFVPYCELRLDMETTFPKDLEHIIHRVLYEKRWSPGHPVEGHTEMFAGLDEFRLLHFMRHINSNGLKGKINLSDKECKIIGNLISP